MHIPPNKSYLLLFEGFAVLIKKRKAIDDKREAKGSPLFLIFCHFNRVVGENLSRLVGLLSSNPHIKEKKRE